MLLDDVEPRPAPALASDFGIRVLQSVNAERRQKNRWRIWTAASLSVAASLAIAMFSARHAEFDAVPGTSAREWRPHEMANSIAAEAGRLTNKQFVLVGKMADGVRPVTSSVYSALNNLWRALPGSELAHAVL